MERIVWPHVKILLLDRLHEISQTIPSSTLPKIAVVEAAVLLDANWDNNDLFDAIWVVQSSQKVSSERLVKFRNMDENDALKRLEAQLSRRGIGNLEDEIDNGCVTAVIENNGNSSDELWHVIRQTIINPHAWKDGRCLESDNGLIELLMPKEN